MMTKRKQENHSTNVAKILVVDDEPAMQKLLQKKLEANGYSADCASNGLEALDLLKNSDYDIVITDVVMPQMDGIALVREIQKYFRADVIVTTGLIDEYQFDQFIPLGARDFIHKPINIEELKQRVKRILKERDLKDEVARFKRELSHAQKLESIGQLAAGIAHEINTPVQYIGDNTTFLKDAFEEIFDILNDIKSMKPAGQSADIIDACRRLQTKLNAADFDYLVQEIPLAINHSMDGVKRVTQIVQSMKEFSHPGASEKVVTDLHHCIENTVIVSKNEWKYTANLELDFDPDMPMVSCNPGEINQVLVNMIINASHAIAEQFKDKDSGKGVITIQTQKTGQWAVIKISDNGTGIPGELIDKIYDPFFTTKEIGKGTGQGLAISHAVIVERHQGQIDIETSAGKGTCFIIKLPLKPNGS